MKKIITLLISLAMLTSVFISGCAEESANVPQSSNSTVSHTINNSVTEEDKTTEGGSDIVNSGSDYDTSGLAVSESSQNEDGEIMVDDKARDTYEFVDETVTNPTVVSYETEDSNNEVTSKITNENLKGSWKPLIVTSVADGKELDFNQAFGSAYSQYGGLLEISDEGSFTLSMGASVKESNAKGTFTLSGNNIIVTYSDGSTGMFLYIPKYQNHQVIKTQIENFYVYFYKA